MDFRNDLPDDAVDEIATLLARGFLRYWKSQRLRPALAEDGADNRLDLPATESRYVTVVNAKEKDEK